jgi:apolipoprotein N-acyltransferase
MNNLEKNLSSKTILRIYLFGVLLFIINIALSFYEVKLPPIMVYLFMILGIACVLSVIIQPNTPTSFVALFWVFFSIFYVAAVLWVIIILVPNKSSKIELVNILLSICLLIFYFCFFVSLTSFLKKFKLTRTTI